ncbi:MAG TPA: hypothetical protein VGC19_01060 [Rhodanobacter sp.]
MKNLVTDALLATVRFVFETLLWSFVLFNFGRITLLLCTFGRYPRGQMLKRDETRIALTGLLVLACGWSCIALYNNLWLVHRL